MNSSPIAALYTSGVVLSQHTRGSKISKRYLMTELLPAQPLMKAKLGANSSSAGAENVREEECASCSTGRTQRSAQRIRIGRRVLALLIVVRVLGVFPKSKTRRPWAPRRRRSRNVILTERDPQSTLYFLNQLIISFQAASAASLR